MSFALWNECYFGETYNHIVIPGQSPEELQKSREEIKRTLTRKVVIMIMMKMLANKFVIDIITHEFNSHDVSSFIN